MAAINKKIVLIKRLGPCKHDVKHSQRYQKRVFFVIGIKAKQTKERQGGEAMSSGHKEKALLVILDVDIKMKWTGGVDKRNLSV